MGMSRHQSAHQLLLASLMDTGQRDPALNAAKSASCCIAVFRQDSSRGLIAAVETESSNGTPSDPARTLGEPGASLGPQGVPLTAERPSRRDEETVPRSGTERRGTESRGAPVAQADEGRSLGGSTGAEDVQWVGPETGEPPLSSMQRFSSRGKGQGQRKAFFELHNVRMQNRTVWLYTGADFSATNNSKFQTHASQHVNLQSTVSLIRSLGIQFRETGTRASSIKPCTLRMHAPISVGIAQSDLLAAGVVCRPGNSAQDEALQGVSVTPGRRVQPDGAPSWVQPE